LRRRDGAVGETPRRMLAPCPFSIATASSASGRPRQCAARVVASAG